MCWQKIMTSAIAGARRSHRPRHRPVVGQAGGGFSTQDLTRAERGLSDFGRSRKGFWLAKSVASCLLLYRYHSASDRAFTQIPDLRQVLGEASTEAECLDDATAAIVGVRRDFSGQLFNGLCDISDDAPRGLPIDFRSSDSAMATLYHIISDLPPEKWSM